MFYDAKFGRKRLPESQDGEMDKPASNGAETSNGSTHVKKTADLAIYEQFQNQVAACIWFYPIVNLWWYGLFGNLIGLILFVFRIGARCTQMEFCLMEPSGDRKIPWLISFCWLNFVFMFLPGYNAIGIS